MQLSRLVTATKTCPSHEINYKSFLTISTFD